MVARVVGQLHVGLRGHPLVHDQRQVPQALRLKEFEGGRDTQRIVLPAGKGPTEDRVVVLSGDSHPETDDGGGPPLVMAQLAVRRVAPMVRLLGDVVVGPGRLAGVPSPGPGEFLLEEESPILPGLLGREVAEGGERLFEVPCAEIVGSEVLPSRERTRTDPIGEAIDGNPSRGLIQGEAEEPLGASPGEDRLNVVSEPKLSGRGVVNSERTDGKGRVDALDPRTGRTEELAVLVARTQVGEDPGDGALPLRIPDGLDLLEVMSAAHRGDTREHHTYHVVRM